MAIRLAAAAVNEGPLGWTQQKVFNQLIMRIRGLEVWIVPCHTPLPVPMGNNFPKKEEPVVLGLAIAENGRGMGDSNVEVPVQKAKTAIRVPGKGAYGVLSHVPSCGAALGRVVWCKYSRTMWRTNRICGGNVGVQSTLK